MARKVLASTCLSPALVKHLKELKKSGEVKSVSEAIRKAVVKYYGTHDVNMKGQNTLDNYVEVVNGNGK